MSLLKTKQKLKKNNHFTASSTQIITSLIMMDARFTRVLNY